MKSIADRRRARIRVWRANKSQRTHVEKGFNHLDSFVGQSDIWHDQAVLPIGLAEPVVIHRGDGGLLHTALLPTVYKTATW